MVEHKLLFFGSTIAETYMTSSGRGFYYYFFWVDLGFPAPFGCDDSSYS